MSKKNKANNTQANDTNAELDAKLKRANDKLTEFATRLVLEEQLTIVPVYVQQALEGKITFPGHIIFMKSSDEDLARAKAELDRITKPKGSDFTIVSSNTKLPPLDKVLG